jgi:outer membrane lipoprotein LolB
MLSACAALSPREPIQRAPAFDLVGRVAVASDGRAFSSGVRWQHTAVDDEIWLMTPLGQTIAHITANSSGATLTRADQQRVEGADVESLTRHGLGWELPLARLAWWVRGEIVPGGVIGEVTRDEEGRLARLVQDDWRITFTHRPAGEPGHLPQRLELTRENSQIRLLIDNWRDGTTP